MRAYPHPPSKFIDFGKLISDSWRLVWRHKFLWFFGLFAGGSTSLGGYSCNNNFSTSGTSDDKNRATDTFPHEATDWVNAHLTLLLVLIGVAVLIGLLLWLWSVVCRGAVIGSVRDVRSGGAISFRGAFARGKESFWRLLLFDLFLFLLFICVGIIFAAVILLIVLLAAAAGSTGHVLLILIGLWLLTFFGFGLGYCAICTIWFLPWIIIGIVVNFANRAVVLERDRPMAALRRSGRLVIDKLTQTLIMFLISVGLSIGASIGLVIGVGITAIPPVIAWIFAFGSGWHPAAIVIASVLTLLPIAALLVAGALMNTYFTTYWTIGYEKLAGNEPEDIPAPPRKPAPRPQKQSQ